jgi:hypothetical protein
MLTLISTDEETTCLSHSKQVTVGDYSTHNLHIVDYMLLDLCLIPFFDGQLLTSSSTQHKRKKKKLCTKYALPTATWSLLIIHVMVVD